MKYAVVAVPAAPVRRKARHRSEMVNQLLFGEEVAVLKEKGSLWVKIKGLYDGYEGWMTNTLLKETGGYTEGKNDRVIAADLLNTITINGRSMHIPYGAFLPGFADGKGKLKDMEYNFAGNYINGADTHPGAKKVEELTAKWLNAPYMWGGRTVLGVDCSGFVQVNYKMMGIELSRDAWQQAQQGSTVKKLKEAVCGDLAFFDDKDEIVHVGILLNSEQIIHASGKVRVDTIDKKGIINSDTGKRTHFLKSIKRYW